MQKLFFEHLLLPSGWARDVAVTVADDGALAAVIPGQTAPAGSERFSCGLPGLVNAHSHAFQRAMAGRAEYRTAQTDSFWTWRDIMYRCAAGLDPDHQRAIATHLYIELLRAGFTSVVEFHYLHHQPDGTPYADIAAMSLAVLDAARTSGIGLTHLPVLYMTAGFSGAPLGQHQRRFATTPASLQAVCNAVDKRTNANITWGLAAHSLRAVPPSALDDLLALPTHKDGLNAARPFHIHIAEQTAEVDDCLAHRGMRPVAWLLDHAPVDAAWTLVHATHTNAEELTGIAARGATVAICPTTEANLGDGLFALPEFINHRGRIAVGTDSHVATSPWEELRWLEYGQRLQTRSRNVLASADAPHTGTSLVQQISQSAAAVTGRPVGQLQAGWRADIIVLDERLPELQGRNPQEMLDTAIFAGLAAPVRHVMVGGRWVVRDGHHPGSDDAAAAYAKTLQHLMQ